MTSFRSQEKFSIHHHHVVPRVKPYVPREETFPIPVKYIDVTRTTHTSLGVMLENRLKNTGTWMEKENCQGWRKRIFRCMDRIHKICSTEGKATGRIFMVREETYKESKNSSS